MMTTIAMAIIASLFVIAGKMVVITMIEIIIMTKKR